jgi:hypothetical protein
MATGFIDQRIIVAHNLRNIAADALAEIPWPPTPDPPRHAQVRVGGGEPKRMSTWRKVEKPSYPAAALISRSAAARASAVISAPASMRAISSRRRAGSSSVTRVVTRLPLAAASLAMR